MNLQVLFSAHLGLKPLKGGDLILQGIFGVRVNVDRQEAA